MTETTCTGPKHAVRHPTRPVVIDGTSVDVDVDLADLVEALNQLGIWTTFCCQGDEGEYAYIEFAHTGCLEHFLTVAADFATDAETILRMEATVTDISVPRDGGWVIKVNWQAPGEMGYYADRDSITEAIKNGYFDGSWSSNVIAHFPRGDIDWLTGTFMSLAKATEEDSATAV